MKMTAEKLFELKEPHFTKLAKDEFGNFNARYVIEFAEAYAKQDNADCRNMLKLKTKRIEQLKAVVDRSKELLEKQDDEIWELKDEVYTLGQIVFLKTINKWQVGKE